MEIEACLLNEIVVSKTRPKTKLLGDFKPRHSLNLAVSKSFLKHDTLNVRLACNDILNKTKERVSTDHGTFTHSQNNQYYSPCVQLRVSYRFNTANSKYKGTGAGQNAKNRM